MPTLLGLPSEILGKILAEAAKEDKKAVDMMHNKKDPNTQPRIRLRKMLANLSACKQLLATAFDAYFINNELFATIGGTTDRNPGLFTYNYCISPDALIESGSFQEHPLFYDNARKLTIYIVNVPLTPAIDRIGSIYISCEKLSKLTICLDGLEKEECIKLRKRMELLEAPGKAKISLVFNNPAMEGKQRNRRPKSAMEAKLLELRQQQLAVHRAFFAKDWS